MTSDPIARYLAGHGARLTRRERLQSMSSGQVLDMALRVYRQLGWTFLRLTLVPSLFCLGAIAFVLEFVVPSLFFTHYKNDFSAQLGEAGTSIALAFLVGGPLFLLGLSYTSALVIGMTSEFMKGERPDAAKALKAARTSVPTLLIVSVRELFLSSGGMLAALAVMALGAVVSQHTTEDSWTSGVLFALGALGLAFGFGMFAYVLTIHSLAPAAAVLEGTRGGAAAKRSAYLLRGQWNHPSGTEAIIRSLFLMMFAGLIEWSGFAALFSGLDLGRHFEDLVGAGQFGGLFEAAFGLIPPFLVVWTILPIWAVCVTIVYYERRIRLEGYDIEVLASEIGKGGRNSRFDV